MSLLIIIAVQQIQYNSYTYIYRVIILVLNTYYNINNLIVTVIIQFK